jgi:hypothetical protein
MESTRTTNAWPWKAMSTDSDMQHATEQKRNQKIEEEARKSMPQILFSEVKRCFVNRAWNGSLSRVETDACFFTPSGNIDQSVPEVSARDLVTTDDPRNFSVHTAHLCRWFLRFWLLGQYPGPVPLLGTTGFLNYNLKNTFIYLQISACSKL